MYVPAILLFYMVKTPVKVSRFTIVTLPFKQPLHLLYY